MENNRTPAQLAGECLTWTIILSAIIFTVGIVSLHGVAGAINAFGDFMRAVL